MADQNGIITGYIINFTRAGTNQSFTRSSTNNNLTLGGFLPFTSYTYQVAAMTQEGLGPFSVPASFLTHQTGKLLILGC